MPKPYAPAPPTVPRPGDIHLTLRSVGATLGSPAKSPPRTAPQSGHIHFTLRSVGATQGSPAKSPFRTAPQSGDIHLTSRSVGATLGSPAKSPFRTTRRSPLPEASGSDFGGRVWGSEFGRALENSSPHPRPTQRGSLPDASSSDFGRGLENSPPHPRPTRRSPSPLVGEGFGVRGRPHPPTAPQSGDIHLTSRSVGATLGSPAKPPFRTTRRSPLPDASSNNFGGRVWQRVWARP